MIWLAILVIFSPVLVFKGLTIEKLWDFFNIHPFWFMFTLGILFSKGKDDYILNVIKDKLDKIIERR